MFWILRRTGAANFFNSTFNNNYSSKANTVIQTSGNNKFIEDIPNRCSGCQSFSVSSQLR